MKPKLKSKSAILNRLRTHFGCEPSGLTVVEQSFAFYERPNLHLAIEDLLSKPRCGAALVGIVVPEEYHSVSLSKLSRDATARSFDEGPVEYADVALAGERRLACVKRGLYLFQDQSQPVVMLVSEQQYTRTPGIVVEAMALDRGGAERFLRQLTRETRYGKAYRGNVLSLEQDCFGGLSVQFHRLPPLVRDELILPAALLGRIERHTLSFSRHAETLRAARRHLKRGILLHGPPGTGKTLTAMYLAAQMHGRTVLILTGHGMGSIETACRLARLLEPATVILEDVDLIGTQRHRQTVDANALLFELLNQMDGLADDCDILFILTTNRPDILEPALAARPGRIDQAIEIPLPDAECRHRLLELYGRGLTLKIDDRERLIGRLEGASGAFIRELMRKAALLAAEANGSGLLTVQDSQLDEALKELVIAGGAITQSLLGATGLPGQGQA